MEEPAAAALPLIAGALCLDFVNTVEDHRSQHPREYLTGYAELVHWARHVEILTPQRAQQLAAAGARRRRQAAQVHQRALALRSALHHLFAAQLAGVKSKTEDMALLNEWLGKALSKGRLRPNQKDYIWQWTSEAEDLEQILYPVARSAADLLTSGRLDRLSECEDCGWLFIDLSRNHSRRWCSMRDCGNRAKARRHYQRTRTD